MEALFCAGAWDLISVYFYRLTLLETPPREDESTDVRSRWPTTLVSSISRVISFLRTLNSISQWYHLE